MAFVRARLVTADVIDSDDRASVRSSDGNNGLLGHANAIDQVDQLNIVARPRHRAVVEQNPGLAEYLSWLHRCAIRRVLVGDESSRIRTGEQRGHSPST